MRIVRTCVAAGEPDGCARCGRTPEASGAALEVVRGVDGPIRGASPMCVRCLDEVARIRAERRKGLA